MTITLSAPCVPRGGSQTLTVTSSPGGSVAFNTTYADGKLGGDYGGVGVGTIGPDGKARDTWKVSPSAALGQATVHVGVSHGGAPVKGQAVFRVEDRC